MDLQRKLREQGWHITSDGLNKLPGDIDKSDCRKAVQSLLDIDLRDVGAGALPAEISRKGESIAGRIVLQVAKIRNISAPKSNEESRTAPRFLHLELTDGVTQIFALEFEHISSISLNTPPGTKLFLRSERIPLMQGILVLRPSDVQVLGGEVTALVEKWELTRTLQKYARGGRVNTGSSGPPPWIAFGQKIQQLNDDKNFKSLGTGNGPEKEKDAKENEFDTMRNEAIAEAAKSGAKKTFGGGNQQMLDHNVKKIIEKGFSELEAKNALRATRNNLERALYNLKRRDEGRERPESKENTRVAVKRGAFKETKKGGSKEDQIAVPTKPAGNVSLFDFLTDKLPANTEALASSATTTTTTTTSSTSKFDRSSHKYDSSKPHNASSTNQQQSYNSGSHQFPNNNNSSIPNNQHASSLNPQYQQQSSQRPAKFENNISSSFANRNSSTNNFADNDGDRNRYRGGERNDHRNTRGGGSMPYSSRQSSEMGRGGGGVGSGSHHMNNVLNRNQMRPSQERERNSNYQQHSNALNVESRDSRTGVDGQRGGNDNRPQKTQSSMAGKQPSNRSSYPNNSSHTGLNNNRNYTDNRTTSYSDTSDKMQELIEDTTKMKLDHKPSNRGGGGGANRIPRSHSNYHHQNHQKQLQHQQPSVAVQSHMQQQQQVYTQLPNGFAYDPNKIIGFQNKESNEYAMNVLKGQSIPAVTASALSQSLANAHPQYSQPPPPMQIGGQQSFHPGPPQFLMQAPPQHVRAFGMPTMDGNGYNWKIGDRCLAKYWDDGRYYEAEITGLSDKTCVVLFLGYGNFEEVLRADCLPISSTTGAAPPTMLTHQQMHPVHTQPNLRTGAGTIASGTPPITTATSGRYRGERQMYVPPPKREA